MKPVGRQVPEEGWLGALYVAEYEALVNHLMWSLGIKRRAQAEDLVSEAFTKMLETGECPRNPRAMLYHIACNLARNLLRDRSKRGSFPKHWLLHPAGSETPEQWVEARELEAALAKKVADMPEGQREALSLWLSGMDAKEVAGAMGTSAATVYFHLSKAREALREVWLRLGLEWPQERTTRC